MIAKFNLDELETQRLRLRQLTLDDAAQLVLLRSDEYVNRYLDRPATTSHDQAVQFVNSILSANAYYWAINLKNESTLIGTVCLWNLDYEQSAVEIGYELLPQFQRKGYMMEVINAIIAYNFSVLKFAKIVATIHPENISSISLLEKNNFKREERLEHQLIGNASSSREVVYIRKTSN
jgi:ribosomal-protein-alanine N-acetyltransferase